MATTLMRTPSDMNTSLSVDCMKTRHEERINNKNDDDDDSSNSNNNNNNNSSNMCYDQPKQPKQQCRLPRRRRCASSVWMGAVCFVVVLFQLQSSCDVSFVYSWSSSSSVASSRRDAIMMSAVPSTAAPIRSPSNILSAEERGGILDSPFLSRSTTTTLLRPPERTVDHDDDSWKMTSAQDERYSFRQQQQQQQGTGLHHLQPSSVILLHPKSQHQLSMFLSNDNKNNNRRLLDSSTSSIMVGPSSRTQQPRQPQQRRGILGFDILALGSTTASSNGNKLQHHNGDDEQTTTTQHHHQEDEDDEECHDHPTYFAHPGSIDSTEEAEGKEDNFFPTPGLTWSNAPLSSTRMFGGGSSTSSSSALLDAIPSIMSSAATSASTTAAAAGMTMSSSSLQFTLPAWFPWIPTKSQILSLKVIELREACSQRGLAKNGNKVELQQRLWQWTSDQQHQHRARITTGDYLTNWFEDMALKGTVPSSVLPVNKTNKNDGHSRSIRKSTTTTSSFSKRQSISSTRTPNSLEEWSRSVDLEKLMNKRQEIHRQKRQGKKPSNDKARPSDEDSASNIQDTISSTKEYLSRLTKAMQSSPSSPYASNREVKQLYKASKQADQLGERRLAIQLLESLLEITPNDARAYRRLSRMYLEQGDLDVARATLQMGLRRLPNNPWLWHGLGQLELTHGKSDLGIKYFQRAITVDPTFAHSYHAWGIHEYYQGHIAKAMKIFKKGIEYCPTNHRLHHALGDLYRGAKLLKDAERSYRRALEEGPPVSHGFAYSALARVAYEQGDIDEARRWLYKSIQLNNGRHVQGWLALAELEEAEGNPQKALSICQGSIVQYEKGLIESQQRYRKERDNDEKRLDAVEGKVELMKRPQRKEREDPVTRTSLDVIMTNPEEIKNSLLKSVPAYRSGDKFVNVFRHWARLEERYGSYDSANRAHERASLAFPLNYKVTLDWARYHSKLRNEDRARSLFIDACTKAGRHHADPYRLFASFEMSLGNYQQARKILFRGAQAVAQSSDGGLGNRRGLGQLFVTWAMCEWHLRNVPRAESLFDHALRLTEAGDEGSELRSFILYCMARLEYYERGEAYLAQHCIGLCLKENSLPGGNAPVWELWAEIAGELSNDNLEKECWTQYDKCTSVDTNGPLFSLKVLKAGEMESWMRQEPWHDKLQDSRGGGKDSARSGTSSSAIIDNKHEKKFTTMSFGRSDFYSTIRFPVSPRQHRSTMRQQGDEQPLSEVVEETIGQNNE